MLDDTTVPQGPVPAPQFSMNVAVRRLDQDRDMFEFIISTPTLKSTFLLPRALMNQLRVIVEKALLDK